MDMVSFLSQGGMCPLVCFQNDRQVTPLERKLQITLERLRHTLSETHPNAIEGCALKLIKTQVTHPEQKDTIGETFVMLLASLNQGENEQAVQQSFQNQVNAKCT
jgi:hypothetical protein